MRKRLIKKILTLCVLVFSIVPAYALDIEINKSAEVDVGFKIKTIVVGSPEIADFRLDENGHVYLFGKKAGETNLSVSGVNGEKKSLNITVSDISKMIVAMNSVLVGQGYKDIKLINMGNSLLVSGSVEDNEDLDYIQELIEEHIDQSRIKYSVAVQKNQQIKIRVTVAEVSKTAIDTLGIEWGQISVDNSNGGGGNIGGAEVNSIRVNNGFYSGLTKGFNFNSMGTAINALVKNNLANVLTTPSLTVTNGKSASFHGGGQIPIFQQTQNGTSVEWKDYGVMLDFSPVINADSSINMDVNIESSQIAGYYVYEGTQLPTIKTRQVKTSVKMKDGETFILAGLIDNSQTQSVNKIPGLSDIPVIGALFKSAGFQTGRSELVIFATIEYVQPTQESKIRLPYVKFSSPWELFFDMKKDVSEVTNDIIKEADYVIE